MSQILLSGTATLDIVNTVDHFPVEDEEMRANASRTVSGGNAANTAVVLAALGHRCHLCALLADDRRAIELQALLELAQVDLRYCPHRQGQTPTSHIIMNAVNGSRTIIHFRALPELEVKDFAAIPFERYDWLHFEGRNVSVTVEVMQQARRHLKGQPISVEIEKPHPDYLCLFPHADVILFSHAFARSQGFDSPVSLLTALHPEVPQSIMVCAWGTEGAWALPPGNRRRSDCLHALAFDGGPVVDTLGAGDTFNAGLINALLNGVDLQAALTHANHLAGLKVARVGLI